MVDLTCMLTFWVLVYGAAAVGAALALALRKAVRIGHRSVPPTSAATLALLPFVAVIGLGASLGLSVSVSLHQGVHEEWHHWMDRLHEAPAAHLALHGANLLASLIAVYCVGRAVYAASRLHAFLKALGPLAPRSDVWNGHTLHRLDAEGCHCFTAGTIRPRVYVSNGLLEKITPEEAAAMLAHEEAHLHRRDGLTNAVLTLFYALFPLPGGGTLYRDWVTAAERDCDAWAAKRVGDSCGVAAALVTVAGLTKTPPIPATGFALSSIEDVEGRVNALLSPLPSSRKADVLLASFVVLSCLGTLSALAPHLSHAVELFVRH
jgi:Zn-dependent protease with chaperone function